MYTETIIDSESRREYEIEIKNPNGENIQRCPACKDDRKKGNQNKKPFSFNASKNVGSCQNCNHKFFKKVMTDIKPDYKKPVWENKTNLSEKVVDWFMKRNISQETLLLMRVTESVQWMPQVEAERNVICFNYFRSGELINIKYRDGQKNFKMVKDAEKIFYNLDSIEGKTSAYIVEGEIDCLTMVQAGYMNTISVPNGATKNNNNLDYLENCYKFFETIEKVYIITDHDEPGEKLATELARRIGIEKCYRVHLGGFKDVNDQLCQTAKVDVSDARAYPITGLYTVYDHWDAMMNILKNGFPKGWQPRGALGDMISFHPGYTTIITGIPGHGKSEITDQMLLEISIDYQLKGGYFSPENWPSELHLMKLIEKVSGRKIFDLPKEEIQSIGDYLNNTVYWIYPEEGFTVDSLLNKVRQAVLKYGIRWYVLDPWNKIEHLDDSTNYVSKTLDLISNFNKKNGLHCFLVAHPTKMRMVDGKYEVPGLYDISGSANFYNKADIGLSMYKEAQGESVLIVQKVKFKYWGTVGQVKLTWDPNSGRYTEYGQDNSSWLVKKEKQIQSPINFYESDNDEVPF